MKKLSILDEKYLNFKKWVGCIADRKGLDSPLTVNQICKMLHFLDSLESKVDDIILSAFDKEKQ